MFWKRSVIEMIQKKDNVKLYMELILYAFAFYSIFCYIKQAYKHTFGFLTQDGTKVLRRLRSTELWSPEKVSSLYIVLLIYL
jgi:hypothetical protein